MDLEKLKNELKGLIALAERALSSNDLEAYQKLESQITTLEAQIKAAQRVLEAKGLTQDPPKPQESPVALPLAPDDGGPEKKSAEQKAAEEEKRFLQQVRVMRYGDLDETKGAVAKQVLGSDYLEMVDEQERAFGAYLRLGEAGCAHKGISLKALSQQVWSLGTITKMLKDGLSVGEIKATMVEAVDVLGGYAVPPQRSDQVLRRMAGLTAVRNAGALVVQTVGSSIEWIGVRGYNTGGSASNQYPTGQRGAWGHETQSPTESNFELTLTRIPVEVYTYKVPLSVSVLEDVPEMVTILMNNIADTLSIDEEEAFVTGDGANKPRGLLPGSANSHSFTELNSGVNDDIAIATTKRLRRKIASQYRRNGRAVWMWESATAEIIETWQDGVGRFYLETVEAGEQLWRFRVQETEAMPSIAASAYPILFGDFSGYAIVERLGMSIVRFMDSSTGTNKVEYQVRRRIGGDVIEPYKFAVIKCST